MRLAHATWALDQQALLIAIADEGTRPQRLDPASLDTRLEREVEVAERLARGQARKLERGLEAPFFPVLELRLEQPY